MTTFKSMPTSAANQNLLENIAKVSKVNNINQKNVLKHFEKSLKTTMQSVFNLKEVTFESLQIDPKNGDLNVQIREKGKLTTHRNPQTGRIVPGKWLPFAWEQDGDKVNEKGEPVDENGLTEKEAAACELSLWDEFKAKLSILVYGENSNDFADIILKRKKQIEDLLEETI